MRISLSWGEDQAKTRKWGTLFSHMFTLESQHIKSKVGVDEGEKRGKENRWDGGKGWHRSTFSSVNDQSNNTHNFLLVRVRHPGLILVKQQRCWLSFCRNQGCE